LSSLILRTAIRILLPLLLLFSVFLFIRGHNQPGGGFVAGLVAAAAFSLYALAYDAAAARSLLRVNPRALIGSGLLLAAGSGLFGFLSGAPYLTGQWLTLAGSRPTALEVGTPLLFDLGVCLVVIGVSLTAILSLAEE
jgi:multicomponent Na+:H+ antiporter subunit B